MIAHRRRVAAIAGAALCAGAAALAGCAKPVFRSDPAASPPPAIAAVDAVARGDTVVWGGKIIDLRNLGASTEIHVVAYPMDRAQRPDARERAQGRFIVTMPGFLEPLDFPPGRFVTVRGRVAGTRMLPIDGHAFPYALLEDATVHRWPANFPRERARIGFGIGIGVGVR